MGRLRAVRKFKEIPQVDMARLVGVSNVTICRYECGDGSPSLDTVEDMAKALGIPLSELFKDLEKEAEAWEYQF